MRKSELLNIIQEEVEVVLTNEEAEEFFDLDPSKLLDEMMKGGLKDEVGTINETDEPGSQGVAAGGQTGREKRAGKQFDRGSVAEPLKIIKQQIDLVRDNPIKLSNMMLNVIFPALGLPTDPEQLITLTNKLKQASRRQQVNEEAVGKGCAESDGGPGCIKKQGDQWVIMNNKKGGVWRKCDSEAHCEEILDAFHASKG